MGALDDHNRQHTFGNTLGPPTSVVGVSAQQAIDAHKRLVEASASAPPRGSIPPGPRPHFIFALISAAIALCAALAAYLVGGIGAVAIGLIALVAAIFAAILLVAALIEFLKSAFTSRR